MNNIKVTLAVTSVVTAVAVYSAPQLLPERFYRAVIRFFIYDLFLAFFYTVFIWPFFVNPLRHLPGPTVSPHPLTRWKSKRNHTKQNRVTTSSTATAPHNSPNLQGKKC